MSWLLEVLCCPYCHGKLNALKCLDCGRQYWTEKDMAYMYDPEKEHWKKCEDQIKALFRLDYDDNWQPRHDHFDHPYMSLENAGIGQKANAGMFNVAKDMIGEEMYRGTGYAVDVGTTNGWSAFRLAERKRTVALDICDHPCYGMGSVPDYGLGISRVVADGCYMPLADETMDIVFACSTFHHMHDKVKFLDEAYRVLRKGGKFVAMGDAPTSLEMLEATLNDGIRDYEGPPYTSADLERWYEQTVFTGLGNVPIVYTDHMYDLGYYSLVGNPPANMMIYGVKA